jgi:hypothetical protein
LKVFWGPLRYYDFFSINSSSGYDLKRFHDEIRKFKNVSKDDRQKLLKL